MKTHLRWPESTHGVCGSGECTTGTRRRSRLILTDNKEEVTCERCKKWMLENTHAPMEVGTFIRIGNLVARVIECGSEFFALVEFENGNTSHFRHKALVGDTCGDPETYIFTWIEHNGSVAGMTDVFWNVSTAWPDNDLTHSIRHGYRTVDRKDVPSTIQSIRHDLYTVYRP